MRFRDAAGRGSGRRRLVGLLAAVTVLAACDTSPPAAPDQQPPRTKAAADTPFANCDQVPCTGVLRGARYEVKLPERWNGTLLLWSHGYRSSEPTAGAALQSNPESAPSAAVAKALLGKGYALAGSAYARNGWAVTDGVSAGEVLHDWFSRHVGKPRRTYVWGASLGGLITATLAEKHPDWVTGVAPVCGVLAGAKLTFDLALDTTYAIKTLLYPEMKLVRYSSVAEARANFTGAYNAIATASQDSRSGVSKLLLIASLVDAPMTSVDADGRDAASRLKAIVGSLVTAAFYGTVVRWDLEQRAGGNPSSNVATDYSTRVTAAEADVAQGLAAGSVARGFTLLAQGQRVAADPQAREKVAELGNPSGVLRDPTVTLHTAIDPLVVVQNQSVFKARVAAAEGAGTAQLLQLFTKAPRRYTKAPYGAGHCNFTLTQWTGTIAVLDRMVDTGVRPRSADIVKAFGKDPGLALDYVAPPWPAPNAR